MEKPAKFIPISIKIEAWLLERLLFNFAGGIVQDKWLRKGQEIAEKRIIDLLESKLCSCLDLPEDVTFADREDLMKHMNCAWDAMMIEYHVALIKGEQK